MAFAFTHRAGLGAQTFHALPRASLGSLETSIQGVDAVPTLITSVKVFDASELTDTVVVSNSFWNTLSSKLPALILAEALATIAFVAITSILIAQGKFLLEVTSGNEPKTGLINSKTNEQASISIDITKLFICILIDIVGSANEAIPVVGEVVDVIYAPIAALLLRQLFQGSNIVFLLEFVEEILPFTDVLPLATICWVVETFFRSGNLAQALRIGDFAPGSGKIMQETDVNTIRESFSKNEDKIISQPKSNSKKHQKKFD